MVLTGNKLTTKEQSKSWDILVSEFNLSEEQVNQFKRYQELLILWNSKFNLTAITSTQDIITYHFWDSLVVSRLVPFGTLKVIADIGAGAGFPGIPLKILFPHLRIVLIEVNKKKIDFLHMITKELNLADVEVCGDDWRTFLRSHEYTIDLFLARASLQPEELIRVFKPSCSYRQAQLVYMASKGWQANERVKPFIKLQKEYTVGDRDRKLVLFALP